MVTQRQGSRRIWINLLVDSAIFIAFLVAMDPRLTGIAIHEWLSIAFGMAVIAHLLLHWEWVVTVTRRFFAAVRPRVRLNYALNALLFISMTIIMFTGVMISEAALPLFGIHLARNFFWRWLHSVSAELTVFVLGLHVALHWNWIVNTVKRYLLKPFQLFEGDL